MTIGECGSHAKVAARMGPVGGKGSSEQALARRLFGRLEEDWLLIAGRGFYNWPDWQAAAATGAALLWRGKAGLRLPVLDLLPDGSYLSVVAKPTLPSTRPAASWSPPPARASISILARRCGCGSSSTRSLTATATAAVS